MKIILYTVVLLFSIACGNKNETEIEDINTPLGAISALSNISKMSKNVEKNMNIAETKLKERRERGDTLAMHYEKLIQHLPTEISGYNRKEPTGSSVNMAGMSYSNAEVRYENENGNFIKITLIDYNQAYGVYQSATAMWALGMSIDSPEEKSNGIKINEEVAGWETFKKKSKNAALTLGIGYRFWLNIEANNQENTDFVKEVAKKVDMDKLSAI
jgi:hypothetical protein